MSSARAHGQRLIRWLKASCVIAVAATAISAYPEGSPSGNTAAPGENSCARCHDGTMNDGSGSVVISGVPDVYQPDQEYTLTVKVSHGMFHLWGFQVTALDSSNRGVGTFRVIDSTTTRKLNGSGALAGRTYVDQTQSGMHSGQSHDASWQVAWKAPAADAGRITFYAAALAANDNGGSSGDSTYTTSVKTGVTTPMVIAPTYKNGKIVLQDNGSNIEDGAVLQVTGGGTTSPQTFTLVRNAKGTKWLVKKSARSSPDGMSAALAWPAGTTATFIVTNRNGSVSAAVSAGR